MIMIPLDEVGDYDGLEPAPRLNEREFAKYKPVQLVFRAIWPISPGDEILVATTTTGRT
jgi:hypothetical protein